MISSDKSFLEFGTGDISVVPGIFEGRAALVFANNEGPTPIGSDQRKDVDNHTYYMQPNDVMMTFTCPESIDVVVQCLTHIRDLAFPGVGASSVNLKFPRSVNLPRYAELVKRGGKPATARDVRRAKINSFIRSYYDEHGCVPTIEEIGNEVGIRTEATIRKYIDELIVAGELNTDGDNEESFIPVDTSASYNEIERVRQRLAIEAEDGGVMYIDCLVEKPKTANVKISFEGDLNVRNLRNFVAKIKRVTASND